jgi:hypothetical protein
MWPHAHSTGAHRCPIAPSPPTAAPRGTGGVTPAGLPKGVRFVSAAILMSYRSHNMDCHLMARDPLSLFLSAHADEHEQEGSLLLNANILVMTAVSIAIALSWGNPVKVFADVRASLTDLSERWPGTDQSTPKIQLTHDAQGSAPTVREARGQIAAASEPVSEAQNNEPPSGALLSQFQAWSAKEDARAQVEPVRLVQDARAQVLEMPQHLRSPCKSTERRSPHKMRRRGPACTGRASTGPACAKCPGTIVPKKSSVCANSPSRQRLPWARMRAAVTAGRKTGDWEAGCPLSRPLPQARPGSPPPALERAAE